MKQKIKVYLKYGHTLTFTCDSFTAEFSKVDGVYTRWNAKGINPNKSFSFMPNEMIAWERLR